MLTEELLKIMACPACGGNIEFNKEKCKIICLNCKKKYPVKDGVPIMLIEKAEIDNDKG